jgi:hypothetical protein
MLTYTQLLHLERALRDQRVLSVYLHGAVDDPAARLTWRTDLDRFSWAVRSASPRSSVAYSPDRFPIACCSSSRFTPTHRTRRSRRLPAPVHPPFVMRRIFGRSPRS